MQIGRLTGSFESELGAISGCRPLLKGRQRALSGKQQRGLPG